MAKPNNILIIGSTGQQGDELMKTLLEQNLNIRATTRDPAKGEAEFYRNKGAEVVKVDMKDRESVKKAAQGMDVAFFLTTPYEDGAKAETEDGLNVVEALKETDVKHIVYSSVADANKQTGIPHFDSKMHVEERLRDCGKPYTIVAPVFFRRNLLVPGMRENLEEGKLRLPMPGDRPLQNISVKEVGRFHAMVLTDPDSFMNQRIDIASDENTPEEMAQIISQATGREVTFEEVPQDGLDADMKAMFQWFDRVGYDVDIQKLKQQYPEMDWMDFRDWAQQTNLNLVASKAGST